MNRVRVAVVTGGSRGIGKSAAEELLSLGYKVILLARSSKNQYFFVLSQGCDTFSAIYTIYI